jgi:hypothetical protein
MHGSTTERIGRRPTKDMIPKADALYDEHLACFIHEPGR